jgi:hypothetical protein
MSLGDSILQTASMARWVSGAVTSPNHASFTAPGKPARGPAGTGPRYPFARASISRKRSIASLGAKSSSS